MLEGELKSPGKIKELEAAKGDFRHAAKRLFDIMSEARGEISADNTDLAVVAYARALQRDEEPEDKITAIYDSVNGGEDGAPSGALKAVEELVTVGKLYKQILKN
jgi:hypothetical protein